MYPNLYTPKRRCTLGFERRRTQSIDYLIVTDESTDAASATRRPAKDAQKEGDDVDSDDDNVEDADNTEKDNNKRSKITAKGKKNKKDSEYGVSRGLDFRGVSFVVNVDFPPNGRVVHPPYEANGSRRC